MAQFSANKNLKNYQFSAFLYFVTASAINYQTTVLKQMRLASDNNLVKATYLTHSEIIMSSDMKKSHPNFILHQDPFF